MPGTAYRLPRGLDCFPAPIAGAFPLEEPHERSVHGQSPALRRSLTAATPFWQKCRQKDLLKDARDALARHFAWLGSGVAQERTHRRSDTRRSAGAALRVGILGPAQSVAAWWRVAGMARTCGPWLWQDANRCSKMIRARVTARTAGHRLALVDALNSTAMPAMLHGLKEKSGQSLAISPPWERPRYEPSKRRLTWPNGAVATLFRCRRTRAPSRVRSTTQRGAATSLAQLAPSRWPGTCVLMHQPAFRR